MTLAMRKALGKQVCVSVLSKEANSRGRRNRRRDQQSLFQLAFVGVNHVVQDVNQIAQVIGHHPTLGKAFCVFQNMARPMIKK
jgi:hypothetical protein